MQRAPRRRDAAPALERLLELDPDDLKPRDALDLLYELHTLARSGTADAQR